jgi:26S proteasome regulatory subunit T4
LINLRIGEERRPLLGLDIHGQTSKDSKRIIIYISSPGFIVKASSGPRYIVTYKQKIDKAKLVAGTRIALDMTTLTIMRILPREVDPLVFNMQAEDPGKVS